MKLQKIIEFLDQKAPYSLAYEWDNVGLLVGSKNQEIKKAILSVDTTEDTLIYAEKTGASLIINHHPLIFPRKSGLSKIIDQGRSKLVFQAMQKNISILSMHTNFDRAGIEIFDFIGAPLGLEKKGRLYDRETLKREENLGVGFYGDLKSPKNLGQVLREVKELFQLSGLWMNQERVDTERSVTRVAWSPGKGSSYLDDVLQSRCDLFLTGEVGYHDMLHAQKRGLLVAEMGHRHSEHFFPHLMTRWLSEFGLECETFNPPTQSIWV